MRNHIRNQLQLEIHNPLSLLPIKLPKGKAESEKERNKIRYFLRTNRQYKRHISFYFPPKNGNITNLIQLHFRYDNRI